METQVDLFLSLMNGLPEGDRVQLLQVLQRARQDQIQRKRHPRHRRRRRADGTLVWREDVA